LAKSRERIFADDNEKEKKNFKDKNTQGGPFMEGLLQS
jgi:hypothetical protein